MMTYRRVDQWDRESAAERSTLTEVYVVILSSVFYHQLHQRRFVCACMCALSIHLIDCGPSVCVCVRACGRACVCIYVCVLWAEHHTTDSANLASPS